MLQKALPVISDYSQDEWCYCDLYESMLESRLLIICYRNRYFIETNMCTFKLYSYTTTSAAHINNHVVSWVCHNRTVRWQNHISTSVWFHCLTRSNILSDVPSVSGKGGSQMHLNCTLWCVQTLEQGQWISACETSYSYVGWKPAACQGKVSEYVPSVLRRSNIVVWVNCGTSTHRF